MEVTMIHYWRENPANKSGPIWFENREARYTFVKAIWREGGHTSETREKCPKREFQMHPWEQAILRGFASRKNDGAVYKPGSAEAHLFEAARSDAAEASRPKPQPSRQRRGGQHPSLRLEEPAR